MLVQPLGTVLRLMVRFSSPGSGLCSKDPTFMTMLAKRAHFLWHGLSFAFSRDFSS